MLSGKESHRPRRHHAHFVGTQDVANGLLSGCERAQPLYDAFVFVSDRPQVFASFLQFLCVFAQSLGVQPPELLEAAGVEPDELQNPDAWIDYEAMVRSWAYLIDRFPGQPLGMMYSRVITPDILGVVGYACANARDLGQAMELWVRYATLLDPFFVVGVDELGEHSKVRLQHEPRVVAMVEPIELFVASWVRIVSGMADPPPRPLEICFAHSQQHPDEVYADLGAPVRFDAPYSGATFETAVLEQPIKGADPRIGAYLVRHADAVLEPRTAPASLSLDVRVREQIDAGLLVGRFDQPAVARELGMSTRSLQRALKDLGTSFSAQLEQVRRDRAETLLRRSELSIAEVAFMLGYADPRPFYRSFRKWTGRTPQQFREA